MKRKIRRNKILALILGLIMIIHPISVFTVYAETETEEEPYEYTIPTEVIPEENIERYGHKERYHKAEESMNEIHLLNEDGTVSAYLFDYPVKYIDDDGITKDKSNKLHESKRNNYLYVNDDNDIKTYFPKKITKKPIIIEADTFSVEIGIVTDSKYPKKGEVTEDNYVFYEQAFGENTAIRYQPDFNGFKEEIILYSENAPTEYSFEIKCDRMYIEKKNGILYFISELTDGVVFKTDPFYIYDSSENVKEYIDTDYTLTKTDDYEYLLTITLDKDYLATKGLTYPVYIDPAIKYDSTDHIEDVTVYSGTYYSDVNMGLSTYSYIGKYNDSYGVGRLFIRLNALINNSTFINLSSEELLNVTLYLYNIASGNEDSTVYAYQSNNTDSNPDASSNFWVESKATWDNIGTYTFSGNVASATLSSSYSGYYELNIINLVKPWRNYSSSAAKQGIVIKNYNETSTDHVKKVATKDYPLADCRPYIVMTYTDIIESGNYMVENVNSGLFMDVEGSSTADGTAIEQSAFSTSQQEIWKITHMDDGYYTIKSLATGKYIRAQDNSSSNGASIVQYSKYTGPGVKWTFKKTSDGNYQIIPQSGAVNNLALAVPNSSTAAGTNLVQSTYTADSNKNDEWILHDLNFTYLNYYDSTFSGNTTMINNILSAVDFADLVFSELCGVTFTNDGSSQQFTEYLPDQCSDTCDCMDEEFCGVYHHKSIEAIDQQIRSTFTIEENEVFAMWSDRPGNTYCEYANDEAGTHTTVSYLGVVYDYHPVIQVLSIPEIVNTDEEDFKNVPENGFIIAAMSIILAHETVHTFEIPDTAEHSTASGYDCIMKPMHTYDSDVFYRLYYNITDKGYSPFCSKCESKIIDGIFKHLGISG